MSAAYDRGKDWERRVFKAMSKVLKLEVKRDSRSGAGTHKADGRDQFNLVPLFIECKDHEKLNVKADWRIADGKSSHGQAPVVVFPDNDEMLCVMRFGDVLQFIREAWDYRDTAEDLRNPAVVAHHIKNPSKQTEEALVKLGEAAAKTIKQGGKTCKNGHIVDQWGYCMDKKCKFSRGYRPPKGGKK